jgi:hypothetical protein
MRGWTYRWGRSLRLTWSFRATFVERAAFGSADLEEAMAHLDAAVRQARSIVLGGGLLVQDAVGGAPPEDRIMA